MTKIARGRLLAHSRDAVKKAIQAKRLVFQSDGQVEYTEKNGAKKVYSIDDLASFLWLKMSSELRGGNLASFDISPDNIGAIIRDLKEKQGGQSR